MAGRNGFAIRGAPAARRPQQSLFELPNEIIIQILAFLDTLPLLQLRLVAHRFQNLIIRIVHSRLLKAASLKDRKLILECYHPSAQYTEPYLHCDYLGTPGLSSHREGQGHMYELVNGNARVGMLQKLYSRFRPTRKDSQPYAYRMHPAGDIPGTRTSEQASSMRKKALDEVVRQRINLDGHELFTQLQFLVSLVQVGPSRGFFMSIDSIVEKKTARIQREWLAGLARSQSASNKRSQRTDSSDDNEDSLIWVDSNKIAGLKVRVEEVTWKRDTPILMHRDEDQAVCYSLELEELFISTTHLLMAVERSLKRTEDSGKAVVFGSFIKQNKEASSEDEILSIG